jgi:hypothetical protein
VPFGGTPDAGDVFGASRGKAGALDGDQEKVRALPVDALGDRVVRRHDLALENARVPHLKARATR